MRDNIPQDDGVALMEVLIALAIFSLVAVAVVRIAPGAASGVSRAAASQKEYTDLEGALRYAVAAGRCTVPELAGYEGIEIARVPVGEPVGEAQLYQFSARRKDGSTSLTTRALIVGAC